MALDCERIAESPIRIALAGLEEVEIGRGDARTLTRRGAHLRLDVPDRWASQVHARLTLQADRWVVEDAKSKNGTFVGRERIERAVLNDGDVLECGGTFLVLRRAGGPIRDVAPSAPSIDALRTLSPAFERELAILPKIARSRLPVLVRGESGTGKELMARAVHELSARAGPFIAVNCGAIPSTLVESELFGSRRGAFSGAEERAGLVRNAEGGTLFLDEAAELPLASQVALLRVLQEGEVLPLGQGKPAMVDVRVIAASHQPLESLIERGQLRRDLYARLRGYELVLPTLRSRIEDFGLVLATLLARIEPAVAPRTLSRSAARALFAHAWPFHIRELEQVLRAAVATAEGSEIRSSGLRLGASEPEATRGAQLDDVPQRERLIAALERHGGNVSAVARALATSRTQVQRLLVRHSLDAAAFARRSLGRSPSEPR